MEFKEISSVTLGKRILFVDDDEILHQILIEQLEIHEEFILEEARTGSAAIQITKDKYFVNRLDFMINPGEEYSVWETVVGWATSRDDNLDPYFVLVPDYEQTLKWTLERIGFVPGNSYQFMSIPLAVNAEEPTLILAGA